MNNLKLLISFILFLLFLTGTKAQIDHALVLDGCTNYLEIPENDLLDYNQVLSIECWVQPNCGSGTKIIVSKEWCQGQYGYYLSVSNGKLFWSYSATGTCSSNNTFQTIEDPIVPDQFTHVAVVHKDNEIKLFINGVEKLTEFNQDNVEPIFNSSEPFRIGAYRNITGDISNYFSGLIDEIRVWNIELTETLIQQRKDIALNGNEAGLVLYLDMEDTGEGPALTLQNQSPVGDILNAVPHGFTDYSPYIIDHEIYNVNPFGLGEDAIVCEEALVLSVDPGNYKSRVWSDGSTGSSITVTESGTYWITAERELCKNFTDSISIEFAEQPFLTSEYTICENDTLFLNNVAYFNEGVFLDTLPADFGCDTILEISILTNLIPSSLEVFEACENSSIIYNNLSLLAGSSTEFMFTGVNGCDSIVTVDVDIINSSTSGFLGDDIVICDESYLLQSPFDDTQWNDGTLSANLEVQSSGTYIASFLDSFGCVNADTINVEFVSPQSYIPNAFSPNGDGSNDCFQAYFPANLIFSEYRFSIYNRWGAIVFETNDPGECWDGNFRGKPAEMGVYIWMLKGFIPDCTSNEVLSGDVTLVR